MKNYETIYNRFRNNDKKERWFIWNNNEWEKSRRSSIKNKIIGSGEGNFLTTDVIKLAVENNIDIVIVDDFGNPCI